jgi:hypothetical protein
MKLNIIAMNGKRANRISRGHGPFDGRVSYVSSAVKGSMRQHVQRPTQHSVYRQNAVVDSGMAIECSRISRQCQHTQTGFIEKARTRNRTVIADAVRTIEYQPGGVVHIAATLFLPAVVG